MKIVKAIHIPFMSVVNSLPNSILNLEYLKKIVLGMNSEDDLSFYLFILIKEIEDLKKEINALRETNKNDL